LNFGFRNVLRKTAIEHEAHSIPELDGNLFALVCIVFVSILPASLLG